MRDAPLMALVRREPDLRDAPVVVIDGGGSHGRVVACTPAARALGVVLGHTVHQARATAPEITVRMTDAGALGAARAALVDAAASMAPRIEPDGDRVYVDVADLRGIYGSEAGFEAAMTESARRVGLDVDVGVASTKAVARIAALPRVGGAIVPDGEAREFLARWPLSVIPMSAALRSEFTRLGIRRVADLAALPREATATRLGEHAARVIALARGHDPTPLFPQPHAMSFEETTDLEWEVANVDALVFVLKRLADALVARLTCRSLAAAGATLSLALTGRKRDERTLALSTPTRDVATLVHLARASLEANPPPDAVTAIKLAAIAAPPRPTQLGLFDPPMPPPEKVTLTLARLAALVGAHRVGRPVVPDTHRPNAVGVAPFEHSLGVPRAVANHEVSIALHVFRPMREAEVMLEHGIPTYLRAGDIAGRVLTCCGPFRATGEWWSDRFDHDAYDVELADGGLYLLGFDRVKGTWRVEGVYE